MRKKHITLDDKNRICLGKILMAVPYSFSASVTKQGKIVLEPLVPIAEHEAWLFKPENRKVLKDVLEGLESAAKEPRVKWNSFKKTLKSLK